MTVHTPISRDRADERERRGRRAAELLADMRRAAARSAVLVVDVRARLKQHEATLAGWAEPDGELVPLERDPKRRRLIRAELEAVCRELREELKAAGLQGDR